MLDNTGRTIDYMRISVTDRCNLRCIYCMPEEGTEQKEHDEMLTFEEIERICRLGVCLGIRKIKLTGGEPLVRKGFPVLAGRIARIEGMEEVTITSNGLLLGEMAAELVQAGIKAVNVSIDSLSRDRFREVTRRDVLTKVLNGIDMAAAAGMKVKINCAVMNGLTEAEILAFADYAADREIPVRFIEMMPIGEGRLYESVDNEWIRAVIRQKYPLVLMNEPQKLGNGPAVYYQIADSQGYVGFISAVHHKFCASCNRVRLTSDGFLKLCLAYPEGIDLRTMMRSGADDSTIRKAMESQIAGKPVSHHFEDAGEVAKNQLTMNQIGG